jgi:MYXO-CTERM domain-containing protein
MRDMAMTWRTTPMSTTTARPRRGGWRAAAAAFVAIAAFAPAARAYVRFTTGNGHPFSWVQNCLSFIVYPNDLTDLAPPQILQATAGAAAAWTGNACAYLRITVASSTSPTPTASYDGQNSVIFRRDRWCAPSDPQGLCSYDPASLAITTVFVRQSDGTIVDADIEVNAKNFVWGDLETQPSAGAQDLQNTLTTEFGHAIGLADTCVPEGSSPVPVDDKGQPVPFCDVASATVRETTMFPSSMPGDVSKRTLAPDDIDGVCGIYPKANDPGACLPGSSDGGVADAASDGAAADGAPEPDAAPIDGVASSNEGGTAGAADGEASDAARTDGVTQDSSEVEAGADGGALATRAGGCACRAGGESGGAPPWLGAAVAVVIAATRRKHTKKGRRTR